MATNCSVYRGSIRLGTGTCADGSATISSWTADSGQVALRKRVAVTVTGAGTHIGRTFYTRVTAESSSLTLVNACPFVGA